MNRTQTIDKVPKVKKQSQQGEFATAREAAQAKTADLMKTLENTDLSFLKKEHK